MKIHLFSIETLYSYKDFISIGDFCLLCDNNSIYLWIENEYSQKERNDNILNHVYICPNLNISCPPDPLIFSYDGINGRIGNRYILQSLINTSSNNILKDVLKNALDILEYKEDRIDIIPVTELINLAQKLLTPPTIRKKNDISNINNNREKYPPSTYYFYDYLGKREQKYWQDHFKEDITTHNILRNIRNLNKEIYRTYFNNFRRDHADLNIYSRKNEIKPTSPSSQEAPETDHLLLLRNLLSQNGYTPIENNLWKTHDNHILCINIKDITDSVSTVHNNILRENIISKKQLNTVDPPLTIQEAATSTEKIEQKEEDISHDIEPTSSVTPYKGDIINMKSLWRTFGRVSSTYKFFWFMAILSITARKGTIKITFEELIAKMITLAYPYTEKRIYFGTVDKIPDTIQCLIATHIFKTDCDSPNNEKRIIAHFNDDHIHKILYQLVLNVPYRFLSTWISFTNNKNVIAKSQDPKNNVPYSIHTNYIKINHTWYNYFKTNNKELFEETKSRLIKYLEQFNDKIIM